MTQSLIELALTIVASAFLVPAGMLFIECLAAVLPVRKRQSVDGTRRPRTDVLVPAHDEALCIAATLASLLPQLGEGDRLVVIADNCHDDTAAIARQCGATVIERNDPQRWGKGYALDHGFKALEKDPPEVLVVVDADSIVAEDTIEVIARRAAASGRPIQATYTLAVPVAERIEQRLSAFAYFVKNSVRPRGLDRLGLPCLLTGSGMAFPWAVLRKVCWATEKTAEDMRLTVDLAIAGSPPSYCGEATVMGRFSESADQSAAQRVRWEHGHLETLFTECPRLVRAALQQRRGDLLALALEIGVPPLSSLALGWLVMSGGCLLAAALGTSLMPLIPLGVSGLLAFLAIALAWAGSGRRLLPLRLLAFAPLYVARKIPMYVAFMTGRQSHWRTKSRP